MGNNGCVVGGFLLGDPLVGVEVGTARFDRDNQRLNRDIFVTMWDNRYRVSNSSTAYQVS